MSPLHSVSISQTKETEIHRSRSGLHSCCNCMMRFML